MGRTAEFSFELSIPPNAQGRKVLRLPQKCTVEDDVGTARFMDSMELEPEPIIRTEWRGREANGICIDYTTVSYRNGGRALMLMADFHVPPILQIRCGGRFPDSCAFPPDGSQPNHDENRPLRRLPDPLQRDRPRIGTSPTAGGAEENMANLRHIASNVLKNDSTKKRGIKGKQKNAPWDHFYLISLFWFQRLCP